MPAPTASQLWWHLRAVASPCRPPQTLKRACVVILSWCRKVLKVSVCSALSAFIPSHWISYVLFLRPFSYFSQICLIYYFRVRVRLLNDYMIDNFYSEEMNNFCHQISRALLAEMVFDSTAGRKSTQSHTIDRCSEQAVHLLKTRLLRKVRSAQHTISVQKNRLEELKLVLGCVYVYIMQVASHEICREYPGNQWGHWMKRGIISSWDPCI